MEREIPIKSIRGRSVIRTRVNRRSFSGLASTIQEHGQLASITVAPTNEGTDEFDVVDGGLRVAAMEQQGRTTIRAVILEKPLAPDDRLEKAFIHNEQREELNAIDFAKAFLHLMQLRGGTISSCAARIGKDVGTVTKKLALLKLPESVQTQVAAGKISWSSAYELCRIEDPQQQESLARQLAEGQLKRDDVQGEARRNPESSSRPTRPPAKRILVPLNGGRSVRISGSDLDLDTVISCASEVLALARRARKRGLELSSFVKMLKEQVQPQAVEV